MATPSERISVIRDIARRLRDEDWALIDLTLRQYSLRTSEMWGGTPESYVIRMVEDAPDDVLLDLARHLGLESPPGRPEVQPTFWRDGYFRLFLSHLATARGFAGEMQQELLKFGISAFVAHVDIEPTKEWMNEIELALRTADALAALLHDGFHASKWTDQEVGHAMGRDLLVIPVMLGEAPYGFLGKYQALPARAPVELATAMFEICLTHRQTKRAMAAGLVALFANSGSFQSAKRNMSLLERVQYWDPQLNERARAAVANNYELKEAFGVPARLDSLLERLDSQG